MQIDHQALKEGAQVFRALNHKLRQQILQNILKLEPVTVSDLYHKMKLNQSVTSQHLSILRSAGLVDASRDGKNVYYSVNRKRISSVQLAAGELAHKDKSK